MYGMVKTSSFSAGRKAKGIVRRPLYMISIDFYGILSRINSTE